MNTKLLNINKIIFVVSIIINSNSFAQSEFTPGFYIINKNAKYAIQNEQVSTYEIYSFFNDYEEENEPIMATTPDGEPLYYKIDYPYFELLKEGQIVNAYMMINNMVFCFDLNGKKVVFSNINDLTKTPTTGSIGLMSQDSEQETMDGPTLCCGYYWILSQNTSNGTVKIQLPSSIVEIQESKISFWKKAMSNEYNNAFKSNEDNYVYRIITVE